MKEKDLISKERDFWFTLLIFVLIIIYFVWWGLSVYKPYLKKKDSLCALISNLKKDYDSDKLNKINGFSKIFQNSINGIRSRLPVYNDQEVFLEGLKRRIDEHNLIIVKIATVPDALSLYSSVTNIYSISLALRLKGDFKSIGAFMQSLEEEQGSFCHIKNVFMERISLNETSLLALIKLDVFFKKEEGDIDKIL